MLQMTERSQNLSHKGSDGREYGTLYQGLKSLDRCPSEPYRIGAREPGCRNRVAKLLENRRAVAHALCVHKAVMSRGASWAVINLNLVVVQ
tara:strand:- start:356 stop:628 length:273 start_codon:yes stop_codon:yes gene_type:complete